MLNINYDGETSHYCIIIIINSTIVAIYMPLFDKNVHTFTGRMNEMLPVPKDLTSFTGKKTKPHGTILA